MVSLVKKIILVLSLVILLVSCSSVPTQVLPAPLPIISVKQPPVSIPSTIKQYSVLPHYPTIQEKVTFKLINEILKMIIVFAVVVFAAGVVVENKAGVYQRVVDFVAAVKAKF